MKTIGTTSPGKARFARQQCRRQPACPTAAALLLAALGVACGGLRTDAATMTAAFTIGTDLTVGNNYTPAGVPTSSTDVLLNSNTATTKTLTFTTAPTLSMESLNVTSASTKTTYSVGATASTNLVLTLGNSAGFTNSYSTVLNDLIYVQGKTSLTILGPSTLAGSTATFGIALASSGNFNVNAANDSLAVGAAISGNFNLTKTGGGSLSLTGVNTFSGTFTANAGTVTLGGNGALGNITALSLNGGATVSESTVGLTNVINDAAAVTIAGVGTTLNLAGSTETVASLTSSKSTTNLVIGDSGSTAGGLTVGDSTATTTFAGVISGTHTGANAALTKQGSGILVLSGANTFTGGVALNAGTLSLGILENAGVSGPLGAGGTISFKGGTLQYSSQNIYDYSSRFSTAAGQAFNIDTNSSNIVFNSALVSNGGSLTKLNSGMLTLNGASTFTGPVNINLGTLQLGGTENPGVSGPLGVGGTINFNGGILQYSGTNTFDYSSRFSTAPGQVYRVNTNGLDVTLTTPLTSSGGTFNKGGLGVLTLTGANTFTGVVTLNGGSIALNAAENPGVSGPLGVGGVINFNSGALQFSPVNTFDYSSRFSTAPGQIYRANTNGQNVTFATAFGSTSTVTKSGLGTLTLTGNSTYTGGVNINGGELAVGSAENPGVSGPLGVGGVISFLNGGALQYSPVNNADYSSRFSQAASQTYGVDTNGQNVTFAAPLTSVGGTLTKTGIGTLTLTAGNTYDSGTTVGGGILQISNPGGSSATGSGPVTVNTGGTLQGAGFINAGANVILINDTLSPGAGTGAAGTITLVSSAASGGLTLANTSTVAFDIFSASTTDLIALAGSALALNGGTLALNLPDQTATGIDYSATYALFTGVGSLTGAFGTVTGYDTTDYTAAFTLNGTEYDLTFMPNPVPEPSTLLGCAVLAGAVGWSARRRLRTRRAA